MPPDSAKQQQQQAKQQVKELQAKWKKYNFTNKNEDERLVDLYSACKDGRDDIVKVLIEDGNVDVNNITEDEQGCQGLSALHITARYNQLTCMKLLISKCADINKSDNFGFRPIHDAALYGYIECLKELLGNGATTTGVAEEMLDHVTPLFYAAQQNHLECVKLLKHRSPSTDCLMWDISSKRGNVSLISLTNKENVLNKSLTNWLKNSALSGHVTYLDRMRKVIERKFGSKEAMHSIHTAAQHGHIDYLKTLLEQGVDPNACNKEKLTPLHYAARYGHTECIEALIQNGSTTNAKTIDNYTPLHVAIRQGCIEGVSKLLECGIDVNEIGGDCNDTPLHICLKLVVDNSIIKEVLLHKPDLTIKDKDGKLPTDIVCEYPVLNELVLEYARN